MSMYFYLPFYLLTRIKMYFNNYLLSSSKKKGFYNFINLFSMINKVLFNKYINKFNNINKLYIKFFLESNNKKGMSIKNTLWFNSILIHNVYFLGTFENNTNINSGKIK